MIARELILLLVNPLLICAQFAPLSVERNTSSSVPAKTWLLELIARDLILPPNGPLVGCQKSCAFDDDAKSVITKINMALLDSQILTFWMIFSFQKNYKIS